MKKVGSILAVALMAFGVATYVVENTANEFEFMSDLSTMLACDRCDSRTSERDDPNT
jgi:hypothetical protein